MTETESLEKGERLWNRLSFGILLITAFLVAEQFLWEADWSLFQFQFSLKILIVQIFIWITQAILRYFVKKGKANLWWYFANLMFAGLWAFVIGGSQMGDFSKGESSASTYGIVTLGLCIFVMGIYLVYEPSVAAFLNAQKKEK